MLRGKVDIEAYCHYVRILTQTDTDGVPKETLLKAYEGLKFTDVMYEEEYAEWEKLPDIITLYRGTPVMEYPPRISWSLDESVARKYSQGQMYKAIIPKDNIMGFYTKNTYEKEVIADVPNGSFDDIF